MSGHWRCCAAGVFVFAGLSATPAFSKPLTDFLASKEATSSAREACALQPGNSTSPNQHWFYRLNGHRKCWFQATALARRQVHHQDAKRPVAAPEENEAAPREKTVLNARAQLLSAAPKEALQAAAPAMDVSASAHPNGAAAAPIGTLVDQRTPEPDTPRSPEVERLLPSVLAKDVAGSSLPSSNSTAPFIRDAKENHWELLASRAGIVLVTIGFLLLAGSLATSRFLNSRMAPIPPA